MIRLIFILIGLVIIYFFIKTVVGLTSKLKCTNCDGKGYWYATRGEREHCQTCNGTGFITRR